uniref:Reverse transcriptase n=1 Tax=Tanacetum cinerariifolium TaxID=118510 RepID=A0A6L2K0H8_TANCI|nr:reverse transcriptase [Tanacetum cinerariifolium]
MIGTRTSTIKLHVDDSIKNWVTDHVNQTTIDSNEKFDTVNATLNNILAQFNFVVTDVKRLKGGEGTGRFNRMGKLEFPKFYGEDVKGWLFRVKQFFVVENVPDGKMFTLEIRGYGIYECLEEDKEDESDMISYELSDPTPQTSPHISLNALSGIPTHNTIRVREVFEVTKDLPPQRSFDHKIPLKEDNVTINIIPYRYPPSQKDTIETTVKELLDSGVIGQVICDNQ